MSRNNYSGIIARAFLAGTTKHSDRVRCGQYPVSRHGTEYSVCGQYRLSTDGNRILSYGHWPIAFRADNGAVWLTTDQYIVGEWPSGKPKASATTADHIHETYWALRTAGFVETGNVQTIEDRTYAEYALASPAS